MKSVEVFHLKVIKTPFKTIIINFSIDKESLAQEKRTAKLAKLEQHSFEMY